MSPLRGFGLLALASALAGVLPGMVYGAGDGLLTALFALVGGVPVIAAVHVLVSRRRLAGSLARQFVLGIGITVVLIAAGLVGIALLMFISAHDALVMTVLVVFAGALTAYCTWVLASGALADVEAVRDGLRAVGEGERDVEITTGGNDELAELADLDRDEARWPTSPPCATACARWGRASAGSM